MNIRHVAVATILSLALVGSASAAPSLVGIGAFAGDAAITFNGLANNTAITNQFGGVTFSGGLFADTGGGGGPGLLNGSTTADNYTNSPLGSFNNPIGLDFSPLVTRVGFDFSSGFNGPTVSITVFSSGGSTVFVLPTGLGLAQFIGITDPNGISRIEISMAGGTPNAAFVIDNLLVGGAMTPEPASMATWAVLGVAGGLWRRRQKAAAKA
jgi:hypothetical protein